jgi:hypothetical protein
MTSCPVSISSDLGMQDEKIFTRWSLVDWEGPIARCMVLVRRKRRNKILDVAKWALDPELKS